MTPTNTLTIDELAACKRILQEAEVKAPYFVWAAMPMALLFIWAGYEEIEQDLYAFRE